MPIEKKWSHYTKENVRQEPDTYCVYELGDTNKGVHYIGEGRCKTRLLAHFSQASEPCPGTKYYRDESTLSKQRAEQRQNALLQNYKKKYGKLPKYNQKSRA